MNNLDLNISTWINPEIDPENASSRRTHQISSNTIYALLADYSKEYKNMHRNDKHHIQENVTSGEGGKRTGLGRKTKEASNESSRHDKITICQIWR